MPTIEPSRRIHVLREAEARKIAAGEVIDRPLSVIRELLDNSIDAGADEITVHVDGGGIERIRVVDNGTGMGAADLETCILPHATSKIAKTEDIYSVRSLGFRGEALASIAACSKLDITSTSEENPDAGMRITVHGGLVIQKSPAPAARGTTVEVSDLFYSLPGRRKFLKRTSSEAQACKQAFIEKALPFPAITFRYFSDGEMKLFLPAQGLTDRVISLFSNSLQPHLLDSAESACEGFSMKAVFTKPDFSRRDKRFVQTYVNGRRIQEYALIQALLYGYSEHLPGGNYPAAFLFIEVDPQQVDFNIHPAKREVRFRNLQEIHRAVVDLIRGGLTGYKVRSGVNPQSGYEQNSLIAEPAARFTRFSGKAEPSGPGINLRDMRERLGGGFGEPSSQDAPSPQSDETTMPGVTFHGQIFGLFLLAEYNEKLYIIDQHAAHERIIFERLSMADPEVQSLLVPIHFAVDEDEESALEHELEIYTSLGFTIERAGPGSWLITSCPTACLDIKGDLVEFIKGKRGDSTSLKQELYATIACRAAVMDGEILDFLSGKDLAVKTLSLDNARCPHGRPIWFEISREKLFEMVQRT
jgi:DNA mismatch repair protein MutL